ncbi:D-aminoacyl-tRNA deacylase [Legionella maceachernii]|uniref:D-aminoacyl-tRNA deacylase n=1 Tax=Legionella maceachernii TaxID=466 RepID=A0A0W0VWQ1_9GAMM|nr:D-aminoacyl-tRNA deacylase [Legionella maceachernii]KTD24543.1 D-tyr-tRNA(Tyr) deacylase [Legionella maceachernii]SJZ62059.1 D-tyrosyl-tRNA(Tyr) deacylase [Legionella maceachernii]SUP00949.1 D-tyrosyl-tRNA(Tyr) deacylase [Legionella maceachernii]
MLTVVQRVSEAKVVVNNQVVGEIGRGLMILCGFEKHDTEITLVRMLEKCLNYRIFDDSQGKMNLSLKEVNGGLLLVPQFTLMADTNKGLRPSFSNAAPPELGQPLFHQLLHLAREKYPSVAQGQFGADMKVHLCNDGPVTFLLKF